MPKTFIFIFSILILILIPKVTSVNYTNCTSDTYGNYCSTGCCYQYSYDLSTSCSYYVDPVCKAPTRTINDDIGMIIGIAVGSLLFVIILVVIIICCTRWSAKMRAEKYATSIQQNTLQTTVDLGYNPTLTQIPSYPPTYGYELGQQNNKAPMNNGYQMNNPLNNMNFQNFNNQAMDPSWHPNA